MEWLTLITLVTLCIQFQGDGMSKKTESIECSVTEWVGSLTKNALSEYASVSVTVIKSEIFVFSNKSLNHMRQSYFLQLTK